MYVHVCCYLQQGLFTHTFYKNSVYIHLKEVESSSSDSSSSTSSSIVDGAGHTDGAALRAWEV